MNLDQSEIDKIVKELMIECNLRKILTRNSKSALGAKLKSA